MHPAFIKRALGTLRKRATSLRKRLWRGIPLMIVGAFVWSFTGEAQAVSSWNPTLLVNTESFNVIDDGDGTTDIEVRFGTTVDEKLRWMISENRFEFSRDLRVAGTITATGSIAASGSLAADANLTINADSGAADAVITFGNDAGAETITFSDSTNQFELSDDVQVGGNLEVNGDGTVSGAIEINDDNSGNATLTFGNDAGDETIVFNDSTNEFDVSDDINVTGTIDASTNISGSGVLSIEGASSLQGAITAGSTIDAVGNITTDANLTINEDNGDVDAVLTFGNDAGAKALTYSNANTQFEFNDDVKVTGTLGATSNLSASGTLSVEGASSLQGAVTLGSTIAINGVTYTFPASAAGSSGKVLKSDATGILSWATDVNTNAQTECGADQYLDGEGNCVDVIEEAEMDSIGELETQIGSVNVIVSTEIDSESELESLLVDVTNVYTNNDGDLYTTGVADARYVNVSGDTMTGNLIIGNGKTLSVSGTIITETNLTINQDNGAADAVLTFGNDAGAETITFSDSTNQFELSDDVQVGGNLEVNGDGTVSGAIEINDDNSGNATLTFGNDAGDETIVFNDSTNEFDVSDDINVTGTIDASTNISGSGVLSIEGASSLQGAITAGSTIDAVGNITTDANLTINEDNGGANAVLTFGNDGGAETIQFNDSTNEFDVSDDVNVTGTLDVSSNLSASGVISAEGNITTDGNLSGSTLTVDGDVTLRGITYTPPSADGSNGQALTTDGAGNLSWAASGGGTGSGGVLFLSPEYPHAVYTSSGSAYIGQMSLNYDSTNSENFYRWTSTKGTLQEYWVIARIRVPDNFSVWDANEPIEFRYRTGTANAADNYLTMRLYDTAGTQIALTGGSDLKNTSWTTATITGPQASGTYTTSSYITIAVKLTSTSAGSADAGYINLNWETTAP